MTLTIGICDDNAEQTALISQYLYLYPEIERATGGYRIITATDPQEFLLNMEIDKPQLVFLDIDMGGINGIDLGQRLKTLLDNLVIIYITAYEQYALEAFRVRAFHYLLKPLSREKFDRALAEALAVIRKNAGKPGRTLTVQVRGEIFCLDYSDIYYFEKVGHQVKIHTAGRDIYYYDNLYNLLPKIDAGVFIQCHQGYIVNAEKIRSFRDKILFLTGNIELPVSRSYAENIKETLARRLFAGKEEE